MRTRFLGGSGLEVPIVCFGAYAIGGGYWGAQDEEAAVRAIRLALDLGMNAFDTAPVYGMGRSEELLGRALHGRRERALILTKVGLRWDDPRPGNARLMPGPDGEPVRVRRNARPESVRQEVDASLRRMRVEHVDLIQVHAPDPETPIADTMGALADLHAQGKVRAIGVSNYTVAMLDEARAALDPLPLASDQPQYSLLARGIERDVLPWARERGVGILAYAPLEQGLLTGRVALERKFDASEGRSRHPSFQAQNRARVNARLDEIVRPVAERHDATIAQVVVAWSASQPGITAVLVGARNEEQVRENAAAGGLELSPAELETIGAGFARLELDPPPRPGLRARLFGWVRRKVSG